MSDEKTPSVGFNALDRVVGFFSPKAAQQRYAARVGIANMRRSYEGAARGRTMDGWKAAGTSADAEIASDGALLRHRSRDLVRNNALAANAVQVLVNNIVGYGIRPRAATGNKRRDRKINKLWERWGQHCDAHGHGDIYSLQALAVREMIEAGDLFSLRRPRRSSRSRAVPLEIELREADHLDAGRFNHPSEGTRIAEGIEYDMTGRRSAYWMFPDHPGDTTLAWSRKFESVRVPANQVAHLFERQRVQSRGVPWGAPAMRALRDLDDWQVAEMMRKKIEACTVGVIIGEDESSGQMAATPSLRDSDGNPVESMEPGMFPIMRNGKDIKFNTPSHSSGVKEWNQTQMHIISAGFRVPYALMTGDLSQTNFSSSRVGINEFRRMIEQVQWQTVIPMLCQKWWDWFCEAAWTAGLIDSPDVPVEWNPPKFESVNPWQDAQTDLLETRAGFTTLQEQIAKRGRDPQTVFLEHKQWNDQVDDNDLIFDSDPRYVSRVGQAQQSTPGEDPEGDGSEPPAPPGAGNEED